MLRFGPGVSRHLRHGRLHCSRLNASATPIPHSLLLNHHRVRGISINDAVQDHAVLRHEKHYSDNMSSSSTLDACNNIGSSSHPLYTQDIEHVDPANQRVPAHSNDQLQGETGYIKETDNIKKEELDVDVKMFRSTSSPNSCIHKIGAIHWKPNEIDTELWHRMNPSCIVKSRHMCSQGSRQRTFARHASSLTTNKFSAQSKHNQSGKQTHSPLRDDCTSSSFNPQLNMNCSQNNCNQTEDNAPLGKTILSDETNSPLQPGSLLSVPVRGDNESKSEASGASNGDKKSLEPLVPPDPETCCGSGCVNCVYIKYVQDVLERDPNDREKVQDILDQIDDFNVKMFIKLELGL